MTAASPPTPPDLLALLQHSTAALALLDADGRIAWCTPAFADCAGRSAADLQGGPLAQALAGLSDGTPALVAWPPCSGGAIEWEAPDANGGTRAWRAHAQPLPGGGFSVTLEDTTEPRRLAAENARLSELLDVAQEFGRLGIWERNPRTLEGRWDRHMFALFGLGGGAGETPSFAEAARRIHPADRLDAQFHASLERPGVHAAHYRVRHPDGGVRHLHSQWRVLPDAGDTPTRVVGVVMDDTRAHEQARRLEVAAEAARVGLWSSALDGRNAEWSPRMYALLGLDPDGVALSLGELLRRCALPEDRDGVAARVLAWLRAPTPGELEVELRAVWPDRSVHWLLVRAIRDIGTDGVPRASGVAIDVTEQRKTLARLREAHERATLALDSVGMGTWFRDHATGRADWDERMFRLRGLVPPALPLAPASRLALVHPDDRARVEEQVSLLDTSAEPLAYEFRVVWPDGSVHWLASRSTALLDEHGRVLRRIGVNWDVTEARMHEHAQRDRELALRESQATSRLLARISHELRTPLNAVLGFTQLLQDERSAGNAALRKERLGHIEKAARHLLELIDGVLELSALDSSRKPAREAALALATPVHAALTLLDGEARAQGVRIACGRLDGQVQADPARLRQVLVSLVGIAIRSTRAGGTVSLQAQSQGAEVLLRVRSDAAGVAGQRQRELFGLDGPVEGPLAGENDGVAERSIELAILEAGVEHLGARLVTLGTTGVENSFELWLPAAASAASAPDVARDRPHRVVYIEDNAVNMMIVREVIAQRGGIEFEGAVDGASGVALAQRNQPDLVLVDMQLPDFDGLEVLRRLRADPATAALRCVALSANAVPEDIRHARAAGFVDYWTKPIDFGAFNAALDELFAAPRG